MNRLMVNIQSYLLILEEERNILQNFFQTNFVVYIFMYFQNFLINKYMPSKELGLFSYYQSILILFTGIYSLEIYSSYLRFIGFQSDKSLLKVNRGILFAATLLFVITIIVFFKSWYFILFAGYMWMRERIYFFRAKLDIKNYGRIKILQYFLSTLYVVVLIMIKKMSCDLLLLGIGISYCLVALIYNSNSSANEITDKKNVKQLPAAKLKDVLQISSPLAINVIVTWLLHAADQMLINEYLNINALTQYSVALRNISIVSLCISIVMEYWPRFYFENMENLCFDKIKIMKRIFFGGVVFLEITMAASSGLLYKIMGAAQYTDTKWMFVLLLVGNCFQTLASINMTFQTYMKNTSSYVICLSVLSIAKFIVNYKFILRGGIFLLLVTTAICYFLYFLCSLYFGYYKEKTYMKVRG